MHGNHTARYFGAIYPRHAHLQALLVDDRTGDLAGRARTIPFAWDGTLADLPAGIDSMGLRAVDGPGVANTLSALAGEVLPTYQGGGLSKVIIEVMAAMARSSGLAPLVAPVRPNQKHLYPLTPIERYVAWQRSDGLPFDPWLRVHARLGGKVVRCEPRSMEITAPVQEWEAWTGMAFPEDGPTSSGPALRRSTSRAAPAPIGNRTCGFATTFDVAAEPLQHRIDRHVNT